MADLSSSNILFGWEGEVKGRSLAGLGFHPNLAAVAFDDFFAKGKSNPRAGILLAGVEALKEEEDALEIFGGNADPIVLNGELPFLPLALDSNLDSGRLLA